MRLRFISAAATAMVLVVQPALAHPQYPSDSVSDTSDAPRIPYDREVHYAFDPASREAWLADCRQHLAARDSGVGGAVIGGVVGGVAGNRIAGRGNRTVGTIAGAAVGAAAGAVIDRAEDAERNRDECVAYLDDYYERYTHGGQYPTHGYGYGYPQGYGYPARPAMMVPAAHAEPECTETVEYVYEDVPARPAPRKRYIPKPGKAAPDKRVPIR